MWENEILEKNKSADSQVTKPNNASLLLLNGQKYFVNEHETRI